MLFPAEASENPQSHVDGRRHHEDSPKSPALQSAIPEKIAAPVKVTR
jgi:hypothetical protein